VTLPLADMNVLLNHEATLIAELQRRSQAKFVRYYPEDGPLRRELYGKHLAFFAAGRHYLERLFLAANRTGKTECAGFEVTAHMTGRYPPWWPGRTFDGPTQWWLAGKSAVTTRDIMQRAMLGDPETHAPGMLPEHLLERTTAKAGIPNAIDTFWVQHVEKVHGAPALSMGQFKSYDQGRKAFEGTERHGIWLDEEPEGDIENECLIRTMTVHGMVMVTFTPLQGLTAFVSDFLDSAEMQAPTGEFVPAKQAFWGSGEEA